MTDCKHRQISAWTFADDGEAAGMWSCADCGRKFVPLDVAQEEAEFWKTASLDLALTLEPLDAAIDAAMKERTHG